MIVTETGYLEGFGRVHASKKAMANVLSFAEVEDKMAITYLPGRGFVVHNKERDILFARIGKLYVAKWSEVISAASLHVTTQETESRYSKAELKRAKLAYQLASVSGYPSVGELINIIEDGNIMGIPAISHEDVKRAYERYGTPVEYVRGKMTKRRATTVVRRVEVRGERAGHAL